MSDIDSKKEGRKAGRGVFLIALAKAYFMVAGAILEFRLPAILTTATFGAYKTVTGLVSPINNVLITGTIQTVSKFTVQDPDRAAEIHNAGLRMHMRVGLPLAMLFALSAPLWAGFFHDSSKTVPIAMSAIIVALYSIYATFVGRVNGEKLFHKQAGLDVTFATLRVSLILGLAALGLGVIGAVAGWIVAAMIIVVIAFFAVGKPAKGKLFSSKPLSVFFGSVAVYLIFLNFIMVADQLLLARLSAGHFEHNATVTANFVSTLGPSWLSSSIGDLRAARLGDTQVGYYAGVQNLARLSYQAIIAVTFVIFPLVSRTTFTADKTKTKHYIKTTMRYSFVFCAGLATLLVANPKELLDIPYATSFAVMGWASLSVLALGNVAFSTFVIAGTILNSAGKTRVAIITAGVTLMLSVIANVCVIPYMEPGPKLLLACAIATSFAMVIGAIGACIALSRILGASLELKTVFRVVLALVVSVLLGRWIHSGGIWVIGESVIIGITYIIVLVGVREFTRDDLRGMVLLIRGDKEK